MVTINNFQSICFLCTICIEKVHLFSFSFADFSFAKFLDIQLKFALNLDVNLTKGLNSFPDALC